MADLYQALKSLDQLVELLVEAVLEEFKLELEDLSAVLGKDDGDDTGADSSSNSNANPTSHLNG